MSWAIAWRVVLAGVLATVTMDVCGGIFRKLGLTAGAPLEVFTAWFGRMLHVPGSVPLAVGCHYLIGITLTSAFWFLLRLRGPELPAVPMLAAFALVYGFATNVFPWLFMFPSMGFGAFGANGPPEYLLFRTSLINHLFFGLGVFWTALVLSPHVKST